MENTNSIIVMPANLTPVIQTAPAILESNRNRVDNAKNAGLTILDKMNAGMTDVLYKQGIEYMGKVRKTVTHINEQRKPITQLISEVSKAFTALESDLDEKRSETVPNKIQAKLNAYAQEQLRIKQEQEAKAALALKLENAKVEMKADISARLNSYFYNLMSDHLNFLNETWSKITLENFDIVTTNILNADTEFKESTLTGFQYELPKNSPVAIMDMLQIKKNVIESKLDEFNKVYAENYKGRKDQIELEFNSKYEELQKIASANKEDAELLQKQVADRELKLQEETANKQREALEAANMQTTIDKETEKIGNLFDASANITTPSISMKSAYEIEVKNIAGWMAVISFWFEKEAKTMTMEQMEKKFGFARKFAESQYNKNDEKINSPFLSYQQVAKAK